MAYSATYDSNDIATITIDGLGAILVTLIGFAGIFALVIGYRYLRGRKVMPNA